MHEGNWSKCCQCDTEMWLPMSLWDAAYKAKEKITFYCAYGHPQVFCSGESKETLLRRERDRLVQQLAERDDSIRYWIAENDKARKEAGTLRTQKRKLTARISHGVCPCCNRTFSKLGAHMATKHPDYVAEAA